MDDIRHKLNNIDKNIGEINVTLAKQSVLLDEHIKRTNLLEAQVQVNSKAVSEAQGGIKMLHVISIVITITMAIVAVLAKGK